MSGETHSVRQSAFEKAETSWRIEEDVLVTRDHKGQEFRDRWADVVTIRIADTPAQYQTWRAILMLTFKSGVKRVILNSHFKGMGDFENRAATYTPFVREALRKVQAQAPAATARTGAGPIFYWSTVIILGLLFAGLGVIMLMIPADKLGEVGDAPVSFWIRIGILVVILPVLILWARKSYPRGVRLAEFPEDKLPKAP